MLSLLLFLFSLSLLVLSIQLNRKYEYFTHLSQLSQSTGLHVETQKQANHHWFNVNKWEHFAAPSHLLTAFSPFYLSNDKSC